MKRQDQDQEQGSSKAERGGDTSRSSSQGRKASSGGEIKHNRKGNPQLDDDTKAPVSDKHREEKKDESFPDSMA
jgi:hypothetical protein